MNEEELKKEALKLEWERVDDFIDEIDLSRLPKGFLSCAHNTFCVKAEDIRGKCDYDGRYKPSTEQLIRNYTNVKSVIGKIRVLCQEHDNTETESCENEQSNRRSELLAKSQAAFQKKR